MNIVDDNDYNYEGVWPGYTNGSGELKNTLRQSKIIMQQSPLILHTPRTRCALDLFRLCHLFILFHYLFIFVIIFLFIIIIFFFHFYLFSFARVRLNTNNFKAI